jgi:hypothetical protein
MTELANMIGTPEAATRPPPPDTAYLTGIIVKAMTYADRDPETALMYARKSAEGVEEKDWAILKILDNYFRTVRAVFPEDWSSDTSPLPRTIGFAALMRLLPILYRQGQSQGTFEQSFLSDQLSKAKPLAPFDFDTYPASGVGENKLYQALLEHVSSGDAAERDGGSEG